MKETLNIWNDAFEIVTSTGYEKIKTEIKTRASNNKGLEIVKFIDSGDVGALKNFS